MSNDELHTLIKEVEVITIDELFTLVEKAKVAWHLTELGNIRCANGLCPGEVALDAPWGQGIALVHLALGGDEQKANHFIQAADNRGSSLYRERMLKACKLA